MAMVFAYDREQTTGDFPKRLSIQIRGYRYRNRCSHSVTRRDEEIWIRQFDRRTVRAETAAVMAQESQPLSSLPPPTTTALLPIIVLLPLLPLLRRQDD